MGADGIKCREEVTDKGPGVRPDCCVIHDCASRLLRVSSTILEALTFEIGPAKILVFRIEHSELDREIQVWTFAFEEDGRTRPVMKEGLHDLSIGISSLGICRNLRQDGSAGVEVVERPTPKPFSDLGIQHQQHSPVPSISMI